MAADRTNLQLMLISLLLPGPSRKRTPSAYFYKVRYRNPDPNQVGCIATWDVLGGRENYQVSLELTEEERRRWHCTCPDSVYRGELSRDHQCKHVLGLLNVCETINPPVSPQPVAA